VKKIKCNDHQANNCDGNRNSGRREHGEWFFHFSTDLQWAKARAFLAQTGIRFVEPMIW
jgi:hypothetical protein